MSFARGVNDTPKIAALLLVGKFLAPAAALVGVGVVMAAGGWISARRVAETMSRRVTQMNPGQGFAANIVTAGLVIGAVTRQADRSTIGTILLAWITTLPLAGALAAAFVIVLRSVSG